MLNRILQFVNSRFGHRERDLIGKYLRSIVERSWDSTVMRSVVEVQTRTPATVEEYCTDIEGQPWIRRSKAFDKEFIYVLSDVTMSSGSGVCWLPDGRVLGESFGSLSRLVSNRKFKDDYFRKASVLNEQVIPMAATGGFFHFMFETLPAVLASLPAGEGYKLLIDKDSPGFVKAYAELISDRSVIVASGPVKVARALIAGKSPYSGFIQKSEIERIQRYFEKRFPKAVPTERIYVSRRMDKRRRLANEDALEKELRVKGFTIHVLQEKPVHEQIELFRKASVVVAPHGAGLANLVWCQAGIRVVEIFPFEPRNDCYSRLSFNLALAYTFCICEKAEGSSGAIPIDEVIQKATQ